MDVVGENWREHEVVAALGARPARDQEMVAEELLGELIPEPDNPHDDHAVSVRVSGYVVGYLSRDAAREYFDFVAAFVRSGVVPTVRVRIWAVTRFVTSRGQDEVKSAVRVALPPLSALQPDNAPPVEPYFLIPRGRTVQVSGEAEHWDVLSQYVQRGSANVLVALTPIIMTTARSEKTVLQVVLDGAPVGQLSPTTSASLLPLVEAGKRLNRRVIAWATILGSSIAVEVTLNVARANEVPSTWPNSADVLPRPNESRGPVPPAYVAQAEPKPAPNARGLTAWLWILGVVVALLFAYVPYVGPLITALIIVLLLIAHIYRKRVPPKEAFGAPRA